MKAIRPIHANPVDGQWQGAPAPAIVAEVPFVRVESARKPKAPRRPARPDAYTLYLERQIAALVGALNAAREGDLAVRLPADGTDHLAGQVAWAFNGLVERSDTLFRELDRVSHVVGREGRIGERVSIGHTSGAWTAGIESVNSLIAQVAWRVQEVSRIINSVSEGDLSHRMPLEHDGRPLQGDALRIGTAVNQLVHR